MTRIFAELISFQRGWGMNVLVFDFANKELHQHTTEGHEQSASFSDFRYAEREHQLTFVIGGRIEQMKMYEISEKLWANLCKAQNWANLCIGLRNKSKKTAQWLADRGILGRS